MDKLKKNWEWNSELQKTFIGFETSSYHIWNLVTFYFKVININSWADTYYCNYGLYR